MKNQANTNKPAKPVVKPVKPIRRLNQVRAALLQLDKVDAESRASIGTKIYKAARELRQEIDYWQDFCELDEWAAEKRKPQANDTGRIKALDFALRYALASGGDPTGTKIKSFKTLLKGAWNRQLSSDDLPAHIATIQAEKKIAQIQANKRHMAKQRRSATILPNDSSQALFAEEGHHRVVSTITIKHGRKPELEIVKIKKTKPLTNSSP